MPERTKGKKKRILEDIGSQITEVKAYTDGPEHRINSAHQEQC
jgi:hypothetical protein